MPRLYSGPLDQATVPPPHWPVWLTPPSASIVVDASELQVMDSAGPAALLAIPSDALNAGIAFRVSAMARSSAT
jgi:ABC-type transporter Mla MlaB component